MANADPAVVNAIPLGKDADGDRDLRPQRALRPVHPARATRPRRCPRTWPPTSSRSTRALELLAAPKGDEPIGTDPASGPAGVRQVGPLRPVRAARRRRDAARRARSRRWSRCSRTCRLDRAHARRGARSCSACPARWAPTPPTGEEIVALNGRYGPYLKKGSDTRSLATEAELFTVTRRRRRAGRSPSPSGEAARRRPRRCATLGRGPGQRQADGASRAGASAPT